MTNSTAARGSTGNVIAAVCSVFVPGLGQLVQGRVLAALFYFFAATFFYGLLGPLTFGLMWFFGLIPHFFSILSAALYKPTS